MNTCRQVLFFGIALVLCVSGPAVAAESNSVALTPAWTCSFLGSLEDAPTFTASTIPSNGDVNPYGVAVVPADAPHTDQLRPGDILVSNFNDNANQQGTGSTIVAVNPRSGEVSTFFDAGSPVGLTTALVALRSGLVIVGTLPTNYSTDPPTIGNGQLLFLDPYGNFLGAVSAPFVRGPWDMTANDLDRDAPVLFLGNVLNGTVVRIPLRITRSQITVGPAQTIGSGFAFRRDPAALVVGPTGLAWDRVTDTLYVADTAGNRIAGLRYASTRRVGGSGFTVFSGPPLQGPLGLALSPERTLLTVNGDAIDAGVPSNTAVELSRRGEVLDTRELDQGPGGGLFGIAITRLHGDAALVYVNDNENTVNVLRSTR